MRTVVVANREDADVGHVGDRLEQHGASLGVVARDHADRLHDAVGEPDLLVLLGSDWSVHDARIAREVAAEQSLVRAAVERGLPVLAICYGAQLAASAFGCRVTRARRPELGWHTITTEDPDLCPPGPWFQFHFDRWWDDGPIRSFAASADAPQAFRLDRLFAVQFHPEVTAATGRRWLRESAGAVAAAGHDIPTIEAELERFSEDALRRAHQLVDKFLASFADATPSAAGGDRGR